MRGFLATFFVLASGVIALSVSVVGRAAQPRAEARELCVRETPHFSLSHTLPDGDAADLSQLLETLYARCFTACQDAGLRSRVPREPLHWLCVTQGEATRLCAGCRAGDMPSSEEAYYSAHTNTVVLLHPGASPAGGNLDGMSPIRTDVWRISHELAHQMLFNTGVQTRGVLYPVWLSEGLAANFETHDPAGGGFAEDNASRRCRLTAAYRQNRLLSLNEIITFPRPPAEEEACLDFYAQAWGMVHFLYRRDPKAFRLYLCTLAMRSPGARPAAALRREFDHIFGSPADIQRDWENYLSRAEPVSGS